MNNIQREHFKISRSSEYFDASELQAQTGRPKRCFGEVILKELVDNALDACETVGVIPEIGISFNSFDEKLAICVSDNGAGINEKIIDKILDFDTRTSDKAAYRSPTRGAQGNAFKTIIGIPHALGGGKVVIVSLGVRHEIIAKATPAGTIDIDHVKTMTETKQGTTVYIEMPCVKVDFYWWGRAFALFNPLESEYQCFSFNRWCR